MNPQNAKKQAISRILIGISMQQLGILQNALQNEAQAERIFSK